MSPLSLQPGQRAGRAMPCTAMLLPLGQGGGQTPALPLGTGGGEGWANSSPAPWGPSEQGVERGGQTPALPPGAPRNRGWWGPCPPGCSTSSKPSALRSGSPCLWGRHIPLLVALWRGARPVKGLVWILRADEAPSVWKGSGDSCVHSPKGQFVP